MISKRSGKLDELKEKEKEKEKERAEELKKSDEKNNRIQKMLDEIAKTKDFKYVYNEDKKGRFN